MAWDLFKSKESQALSELQRIRKALEVMALYVAKLDGRMWSPEGGYAVPQSEELAELLHTEDAEILVGRLKGVEDFKSNGFEE